MNELKPVNILGVNVYPYTKEQLIQYAVRRKKVLFSINAEILLYDDFIFKEILNRGVGYADGIGAVWALKKKGLKNVIKQPGCELWLDIVRKYEKYFTFYFIGATPSIMDYTIEKLKRDFPDISIKGYRDGYINDENEKQLLIANIKKQKPDVIFVAMGVPKQEFLIDELYGNYQAVYMGLGGSFDVYTGNVERAPKWWVDHNLEFLYRLIKQPKRIKRQIHLVSFFLKLLFNRL